jgi:general secretion pathway protein F
MPVFKYKAADKGGKTAKGFIDAPGRAQAVQKLRELGLYPIDVTKARGGAAPMDKRSGWNPRIELRRSVSREAVAATVRQLATLLRAELPLDKALDAVVKGGRQTELTRIVSEIRESIREGADLATTFAAHPRLFNETFVTMIRAGEASGTLGLVMERLADHMEQQIALRRKIRASLAYPLFTMAVGVLVVIFLLLFVVPKVTEIFADMNHVLPLPTRILISISDFARDWWAAALILLCLCALGLHRLGRTPRGKAAIDRFLLKVPVLKDLLGQLAVKRFTETLGMLLKNGSTLVSALSISRNVVGNAVIRDVVEQIHREVQEGKPLTGPMESCPTFDHATVQLISAGEQSGHLEEMLLLVAKDCGTRIDARFQVLTSMLEPLMILALGGMVGFVVMAVLLPIFEMSSLLGG